MKDKTISITQESFEKLIMMSYKDGMLDGFLSGRTDSKKVDYELFDRYWLESSTKKYLDAIKY